jgi:preprotein translocase subunit SecG
MGVLTGFATVVFIILCVLLILVILLQSDKSAGMGILGGSSQSAFGSSTADVITKITAVMVALFLLGSLGISALHSMQARSLEKQVIKGDLTPTGVVQEKVPDAKDAAASASPTKK